MASRRLGVLARCASALVALFGIGACTDDGVSLHVICPIFPEIEDSVCVYEAASERCVLEGVMNLDLTLEYKQSLRVESGLKAREREVPPLAETNGIQVRTVKVEIRLPSGARLQFSSGPNPYRVVATGYIPPESSGVVSLTLIPPNYGAELRSLAPLPAQVVLGIEIEGKTSGDQSVRAGEYAWPVRLLDGTPNGGTCAMIEYCPNAQGQDAFATACE